MNRSALALKSEWGHGVVRTPHGGTLSGLQAEWGLGSFGLGTWARITSSKVYGNPGWDKLGPGGTPINSTIAAHMSNATNPDRKRWVGFAVAALRSGKYDMRDYANSGGPTVTQPDSKFWTSTPERKTDHDQFLREGGNYTWEEHGGSPITAAVNAVEKIPVVGSVVKIVGDAASAPVNLVTSIASGERIDHALVDNFKAQLKTVKEVAPYAATVVSFVPGIGTGVAAAIGAGAALAEGQSITSAIKAGIRDAIPGGTIAAAGFDAAMKVASGENVGKAALESARNLIPPGAGQKAFDIGLAVVTGEKLQTALANGLVSLAPGQLQNVLAIGTDAIKSTPGLANVVKDLAPAATEGATLAAGLLSHSGVNEKSLTAVRKHTTSRGRAGVRRRPQDAGAAHRVARERRERTGADDAFQACSEAPDDDGADQSSSAGSEAPDDDGADQAPSARSGASTGEAAHDDGADQNYACARPLRPLPATERRGTWARRMRSRVPQSRGPHHQHGRRNASRRHVSGARLSWAATVGARPRRPQLPLRNPQRRAVGTGVPFLMAKYGPYPGGTLGAPHGGGGHGGGGHGGGHGGGGHGGRGHTHPITRSFRSGGRRGSWWDYPWTSGVVVTTETCSAWGDPIEMPISMRNAGSAALDATGGRPAAVRGPDGALYLFTLENGVPVARPCAAVTTT